MSLPSTLYRPLDTTKSEIRLLRILSDDSDTCVRCALETVCLTDNPSFCALSYVWGDPSVTADILIASEDTGGLEERMAVTTNLELALRFVPPQWASAGNHGADLSAFRLWVDAICINQKDVREREAQVQIMGSIYQSAEFVMSWLGPDDLNPGFISITSILSEVDGPDFHRLEWLRKYPSLGKKIDGEDELSVDSLPQAWKSIRDILTLPYWKRIWIFQEVALAKDITLVTKNGHLRWQELVRFWAAIDALRTQLEKTGMRRPEWMLKIVWVLLNTELTLGDTAVLIWVRYLQWVRRQGHDSTNAKDKPETPKPYLAHWNHWCVIVSCPWRLRATRPRDYVFGLLGVSGINMKANYSDTTTTGAIYSEFLKHYLKDTRVRPEGLPESRNSLCFLGHAGIGLLEFDHALPSWTPNYAKKSLQVHCLRITESKCYMADKNVFETAEEDYPVVDGLNLRVKGLVIDKVASVSEVPGNDSICDGRMLEYIADFISRCPTYVSGVPSLHAFFCLINCSAPPEFDHQGKLEVISFVNFLVSKTRQNRGDPFELLGWHSRTRTETFDEWCMRNFFPHISSGSEQSGPSFWDYIRKVLCFPHSSIEPEQSGPSLWEYMRKC